MSEDPRLIPPVESFESVMWHCGRKMAVTRTCVEGQVKLRYWKCRVCGATCKSVMFIPLGRVAEKMAAWKRR